MMTNTLLPKPGARKEALLALMPPCDLAAEIGADHGITAAHLLRSGIAGRLLVTDISAASLAKAKRLFALHGLLAQAEFRVADGLDALDGPVGAVLVAGLGTATIRGILQRGRGRIGNAALILQPQQDPVLLRRWLMENGFSMDAERIAQEDGRYYVVMRASRGHCAYSERELLLGPCLARAKEPPYREYLAWQQNRLRVMRHAQARQAVKWIEEELSSL